MSNSLDVNESNGPDGIIMFLLNNTADALAKPLYNFFILF